MLRELVRDSLERNPALATSIAVARASLHQAPQAQALPDPVVGVTGYLSSPETRVGPQRLMATLSQRLPWSGKRSLRQQAAHHQSEALVSDVSARRLDLVTEVRRLSLEIAYLDAYRRVVETDRDTLIHYEQLARARYASGEGIEQGVIKIQAEITKDDNRLLEIAIRRATLVAALNALRDSPPGEPDPRDRAAPRHQGRAAPGRRPRCGPSRRVPSSTPPGPRSPGPTPSSSSRGRTTSRTSPWARPTVS